MVHELLRRRCGQGEVRVHLGEIRLVPSETLLPSQLYNIQCAQYCCDAAFEIKREEVSYMILACACCVFSSVGHE